MIVFSQFFSKLKTLQLIYIKFTVLFFPLMLFFYSKDRRDSKSIHDNDTILKYKLLVPDYYPVYQPRIDDFISCRGGLPFLLFKLLLIFIRSSRKPNIREKKKNISLLNTVKTSSHLYIRII